MLPSIWKKDEWLPLAGFRNSMERLFENFFEDQWLPRFSVEEPAYFPPVEVRETEEALLVEMEVPGMTEKDVTVQVNGEWLFLKGERKHEEEKKTKTYYQKEFTYGKFERKIQLPVPVESEKVEAAIKGGILTVTLPKQAGAKTKTFAVKVKGT